MNTDKETKENGNLPIFSVAVRCSACNYEWIDSTEHMTDNRIRTIITDICHVCSPNKLHVEKQCLDEDGNAL